MSTPIKIRDIKVKPATKKFEHLLAEESPAITVKMPLAIINGAKSASVLYITEKFYGTKYMIGSVLLENPCDQSEH